MSWFKPKPPETMRLPFPAERLAVLGTMIIPAAIVAGIKLRQDEIVLAEDIWNSQFLNSYVCSYPNFLDERDPRLGAIVRHALLRVMLARNEQEAQLRCDAFKVLADLGDPATIQIARLAAEDGTHYFRALSSSDDADESATANLTLAIRSWAEFPAFLIPASGL